MLVGLLLRTDWSFLVSSVNEVSETQQGNSGSFGLRFMKLVELLIPQSLAEQCVGSSLEDLRTASAGRWEPLGQLLANWWLVKEALYSLWPIAGIRLVKLLLLPPLGYLHCSTTASCC